MTRSVMMLFAIMLLSGGVHAADNSAENACAAEARQWGVEESKVKDFIKTCLDEARQSLKQTCEAAADPALMPDEKRDFVAACIANGGPASQ